MRKSELDVLIRRIVDQHRLDRDGGYELVEYILHLKKALPQNDKALLREYLLEKVEQKFEEFWGIALEVLIHDESKEVGNALESMLRARNERSLWTEQVFLALLRMGHPSDLYIPHISSLLDSNRPVCAELAHLYKVSPDLSVKLSAHYFAKELASENGVCIVENCISVFIHNYPKQDQGSLSRLVEETHSIDPEAGKRLNTIIVRFLSKPWVEKELGSARTQGLLAILRANCLS